jgi:hypothetical protein
VDGPPDVCMYVDMSRRLEIWVFRVMGWERQGWDGCASSCCVVEEGALSFVVH